MRDLLLLSFFCFIILFLSGIILNYWLFEFFKLINFRKFSVKGYFWAVSFKYVKREIIKESFIFFNQNFKRQFRKYENFSQTIRNQSILLYIRNIKSKINSQIG